MTTEFSQRTVFETVIERGIAFLLVFTPLAFGGVQDWAASVMELAAFVVLAAWLADRGRKDGAVVHDRTLLLLFSGLALFVVLQLVPVPGSLLRFVSPATAEVYNRAGLDPDAWRPVSLSPWSTTQYLLKLLAYGSVFFVVINHYRERERIERLIRFILFMALGLVVFAFVQKATWNGRIFWLYPVEAHAASARNFSIWGPFINRNHFAGYLEMVIPLGLGLLLHGTVEAKSLPQGSVAVRLASLLASKRFPLISFWGVSLLVMSGALFMTLSRGGIIAFSCSAGLLFLLARMRRGLKRKINGLALAGVLLVLMIVVAGWDRIEDRFSQLGEEHSLRRADVWIDSIGIVKDFPLLGTGFGTYRAVYPKYQTHSSLALYDHAHNDYVEALTDLGTAGFLAAAAFVCVFLAKVVRQWFDRHRSYVKSLGAGGIASCGAMLVHGMTDFNLHIPANAVLLAVVAGLTYSTVFHAGRNEL